MFNFILIKKPKQILEIICFYLLFAAINNYNNLAIAQVKPDNTLTNPSLMKIEGNTITIEGGTRANRNLFHSFQEFSIPLNNTLIFNNPLTIENIITRVTGNQASQILGRLGVLGDANLFLLNPNGIIFGENASLGIAGSFIATTANSIEFSDRTVFTTNPNTAPVLTVSVPFGLGFGSTPGTIINQSRFSIPQIPTPLGLAVSPGKTLALIGGDIFINGGVITAFGGNIQLGSVQSSSQVYLTPDVQGWTIDYRDVPKFGNIQLSQAAEVSASGLRGGEIQIVADKVRLTERSHLLSVTQGAESGRGITINATDAVEIIGDGTFLEEIFKFTSGNFVLANSPTGLFSFSVGSGSAGNILINTNSFIGKNSAFVLSSTLGAGNGGNLTLNATKLVEVDAGNLFTGTGVLATGHAGNLTINTSYLKFLNNGFASTTNLGNAQAGNLNVNATELVELIGKDTIILPGGQILITGIFSSSFGSKDAANLSLDTKRLIISNGANIGANNAGSGRGGNIRVNASESIKLAGQTIDGQWNSSITASGNTQGGNATITTENLEIADLAFLSASGKFRGGNLEINTNSLHLNNQGFITVTSELKAGNLEINANSINLNNRAVISATSKSGEGGNIQIKTSQLQLNHNSIISTTSGSATGTGNGGNIDIITDTLVALDKSKIAANAFQGNGGNITIHTQGNFFSPDSTLSASSELGVNGTVIVNNFGIDFKNSLTSLKSEFVSPEQVVAGSCLANRNAQQGSFTVTGTDGLRRTPFEPMSANYAVTNITNSSENLLNNLNNSSSATKNDSWKIGDPVREAQGLTLTKDGHIVLAETSKNSLKSANQIICDRNSNLTDNPAN